MDDAGGPYEVETDEMGENIHVENVEIESNGRRIQVTLPNIAKTMRSIRVEFLSCRVDNESLIRAREEHNHINATML